MIRAVTIDAHGVLLLPNPNVIRSVLKEYGCSPDDESCAAAHFEMMQILDHLHDDDWPYMNRCFAKALGVQENVQDEAGAKLADKIYRGTSWIPAVGASAALSRLVTEGYGAAVVSNTFLGDIAELLAHTELCSVDGDFSRVAAIVDSRVLGIGKPDPRPFLVALKALGVSPQDCVHVGDSLRNDVVGAIGVGMRAVHVDPLEDCRDQRHGHVATFAQFVDELLGP